MSGCPAIDELDDALAGRSDGAVILAHLETCAKCRLRAERMRANNDLAGVLAGMGSSQLSAALTARPRSESPRHEIAGYEIGSEIHRGGQGVVYEAIQTATKRRVALKMLIHGAFATPRQRQRFEREIELVAGLRHPNIVTVYESGVTADGRHYFAMEYVAGQPLDRWISNSRFPISDWSGEPTSIGNRKSEIGNLLRLFAKICAAVNAAHQHGIIHRDLKPGNILVDGAGEPRVVDFGLAKTVGLNGETAATQVGEFLGTFAYAAPEQVKGDPDEIDTRTDVYALGVILYEMLTGRHPYPVAGAVADVLRNITQVEPKRPSLLNRRLDAELDAIVLKALTKERERRYQLAGALEQDIVRYLSGEAIEARRDSHWYVVIKTAMRHRTAVAAASGLVVLLAAFGATMSVLYRRAARAERAADQRRIEVEREADKVFRIRVFLTEMLASADPDRLKGRDVTVREVLDAAAAKIESELGRYPEVQAEVRETIGSTYAGLGLYDQAESHLRWVLDARRRVAEPDDPGLIKTLGYLANVLRAKGALDEAERLFREALAAARRRFGDDSARVSDAANGLSDLLCRKGDYAAAQSLAREVLPLVRRQPGHSFLDGAALNNLAGVLDAQGDYANAEVLLRHALDSCATELGARNPVVLGLRNNLAWVLYRQKDYDAAEPMARSVLAVRREGLPELHASVGSSAFVVGAIVYGRGDARAAEPLLRESVEIRRQALPAGHVDTAEAEQMLGRCLTDLGQYDTAERLLVGSLPVFQARHGEGDAGTRSALEAIVTLYEHWGQPERAAEYRALLGPEK